MVVQTGDKFTATATFTALAAPLVTPTTPGLTEGTPGEVFAEFTTADPGLKLFANPTGTKWLLHDQSQVGTAFESVVNDLTEIVPGMGLWVFNSTDSDITKIIFGRNFTVKPGWSLKGV